MALLTTVLTTVLVAVSVACAPRNYDNGGRLGVLPPQPPKPLWLGAFRASPADTSLRGAVAVTLSSTPGWSHVLISVSGARPSASYIWRVHSGHCAESGPAIGPDDRYQPLVPFADGTAKGESTIPMMLTPSAPYSATVTEQSGATLAAGACAELDYGSM